MNRAHCKWFIFKSPQNFPQQTTLAASVPVFLRKVGFNDQAAPVSKYKAFGALNNDAKSVRGNVNPSEILTIPPPISTVRPVPVSFVGGSSLSPIIHFAAAGDDAAAGGGGARSRTPSAPSYPLQYLTGLKLRARLAWNTLLNGAGGSRFADIQQTLRKRWREGGGGEHSLKANM